MPGPIDLGQIFRIAIDQAGTFPYALKTARCLRSISHNSEHSPLSLNLDSFSGFQHLIEDVVHILPKFGRGDHHVSTVTRTYDSCRTYDSRPCPTPLTLPSPGYIVSVVRRLMSACRVLLALFLLLGTALAEDTSQYPPGPGRDVFIRICTRCHEAANSTKLRLTRRQWQGKVYQQADRGAEVSGEELDQIVEYLAKNFGPDAKPAPGTSK